MASHEYRIVLGLDPGIIHAILFRVLGIFFRQIFNQNLRINSTAPICSELSVFPTLNLDFETFLNQKETAMFLGWSPWMKKFKVVSSEQLW